MYELCAVIRFGFPHCDDVKSVGLHNPRRVVAKSVMKRSLVLPEDFVNSELMDHLRTSIRFMLGLIYQACRLAPFIKNRIYMHHHTYVFTCILPCSRYWPILRDGASLRCSAAANTQ